MEKIFIQKKQNKVAANYAMASTYGLLGTKKLNLLCRSCLLGTKHITKIKYWNLD